MKAQDIIKSVKWWESKRWIFNLVLLVFGLLGVYKGLTEYSYYDWENTDTIVIILFVLLANICYSIGILSEIWDGYYFKNRIGIKNYRLPFLLLGLLITAILSYYATWARIVKPWFW